MFFLLLGTLSLFFLEILRLVLALKANARSLQPQFSLTYVVSLPSNAALCGAVPLWKSYDPFTSSLVQVLRDKNL